ncbi:MAG: class I SAM-dependent methyltransferase [Kiritimatiellaceae bacterium]|nr:class I SAM-dependent methyltransferase [Kiritimatiellaceae bacterium]
MKCHHCHTELEHVFLDLGFAPPSNSYLTEEQLRQSEKTYPLKLYVCENCWLVQTEDNDSGEALFQDDYAYFSSVSSMLLGHSKRYCDMITQRLGLTKESYVIEVASNDGYLLRNFVESKIPCLGIEPTAGTAEVAAGLGIPQLGEFFGEALGQRLAAEGKQSDLMIGNNVYAHVPDINDFTRGFKQALKPEGTVTLEFPHLLSLMTWNQFDTVYHEHYSYLSLNTVSRIFKAAGLRVYDVEEVPTHGGSLRVYGCHAESAKPTGEHVAAILKKEADAGLAELGTYLAFQARVEKIKDDFVAFLIEQKRAEKKVAAYGAAAKASTLMNFAGVRPDLVAFISDAAPSKQYKFVPGCHVPVLPPDALKEYKPDWVVVFAWNIAKEIMNSLSHVKEWCGKFIVVIPELKEL